MHSIISLHAGFSMFKAALSGVLFSPTSFFDTTPMGECVLLVVLLPSYMSGVGRIVSRLSKVCCMRVVVFWLLSPLQDQDTIDQELSLNLYQVTTPCRPVQSVGFADTHTAALFVHERPWNHWFVLEQPRRRRSTDVYPR
jgi:hypothetical protein